MSFSQGFRKTAVIGPILSTLGRGAVGAAGMIGKGALAAGKGVSRLAGGPFALAANTWDATNQFNQNMNALARDRR